jgi:diguanylate cyclase (GGDEF)-like protein
VTGRAIDVLLIEDDPGDADYLKEILSEETSPPFHVETAERLGPGLARISDTSPDVVLLDLTLPDSHGLETFARLRESAPGVPVVILSGLESEAFAYQAVGNGAQDYLVKDRLDRGHLVRTIRYAIERDRINKELDVLASELKSTNARLEKLALLDPLTELLNRRGLQEALNREMQRARRQETDLLVLLVDLDNFKRINDRLGHAVGDVVLKEIARKLTGSLRATDYVARIGGDEFMILLPQTRPPEGLRVAENVRLSVSATTVTLSSGDTVNVTASIGVLTASPETPWIDELLARIHLLLARSKNQGRNRVSFDHASVAEAEEVEAALPRILDSFRRGMTLRTVRQPILDLDTFEDVGYEFLSRSSQSQLEMPDDFFRVCAENNILTLVDHHCLRRCIDAGRDLSPVIRRHINIFPSTLIEVPIEHLLAAFPADRAPGSYCAEVSEQQVIGDPSYLSTQVHALKKEGICVAIDDVGFGRSCLESLVLLEPDIVKIDKRCVLGLAHEPTRQRSLERLLKVAEALGTEAVAEGVETSEDLYVLKELGVRLGQGYLLGRPT